MTNLVQRTISGIVYVALCVSAICISPYTFAGLFAAITALALSEFYRLTDKSHCAKIQKIEGLVGGVLLFCCAFVVAQWTWCPILYIYAMYVVGVLVAELFLKAENPVQNWANFLLGQIMIALPFSLLNPILLQPEWRPIILLAMFVTIWMNDTWAYLFGSKFGKHKLFPRISPKKSWEGFVGGAIMSLLTGWVFSLVMPEVALWKWLLFAEIVVIFGTIGDLMESLLKRTVQVKDSGNLIPGHGGILDRFDSMLLATPAIYLLLKFLVW